MKAYKEFDPLVWKMRTGVMIRICDMETSHIKNCLSMLEFRMDSDHYRQQHKEPFLKTLDIRSSELGKAIYE